MESILRPSTGLASTGLAPTGRTARAIATVLTVLAMTGMLCWADRSHAAGAAQPAPDARKLYEARCQRCHGVERIAPELAAKPIDERIAYLGKFLRTHFAPDAAERDAIAAWLAREVEASR